MPDRTPVLVQRLVVVGQGEVPPVRDAPDDDGGGDGVGVDMSGALDNSVPGRCGHVSLGLDPVLLPRLSRRTVDSLTAYANARQAVCSRSMRPALEGTDADGGAADCDADDMGLGGELMRTITEWEMAELLSAEICGDLVDVGVADINCCVDDVLHLLMQNELPLGDTGTATDTGAAPARGDMPPVRDIVAHEHVHGLIGGSSSLSSTEGAQQDLSSSASGTGATHVTAGVVPGRRGLSRPGERRTGETPATSVLSPGKSAHDSFLGDYGDPSEAARATTNALGGATDADSISLPSTSRALDGGLGTSDPASSRALSTSSSSSSSSSSRSGPEEVPSCGVSVRGSHVAVEDELVGDGADSSSSASYTEQSPPPQVGAGTRTTTEGEENALDAASTGGRGSGGEQSGHLSSTSSTEGAEAVVARSTSGSAELVFEADGSEDAVSHHSPEGQQDHDGSTGSGDVVFADDGGEAGGWGGWGG